MRDRERLPASIADGSQEYLRSVSARPIPKRRPGTRISPLGGLLLGALLISAIIASGASAILISYVGALALQVHLVRSHSASPMLIMLGIWALCFVNVLIGPLTYPDVGPWAPALTYLTLLFLCFSIPYVVMARNSSVGLRTSDDLVFRNRGWLALSAFLGMGLLIVGGLMTALPYLLALNLGALRASFINELNILTQLGWLFLWPAFVLLVAMCTFRNYIGKKSFIVLFFGLAVIPLFSAGRQLYLQMILLIALTFSFSLRRGGGTGPTARSLRSKIRSAAILVSVAVACLVAVTALRFDPESQAHFGSKLRMYGIYSGVNLTLGYEVLWERLSPSVQDLWVEFAYYFGAQLVRFVEVYNSQDFELFGFDVLKKVPFIERNFYKLLGLPTELVLSDQSGIAMRINSFTWRTTIPANMELYGEIGALLISSLFGALSGLAIRALRRYPESIEALNFCVANGVVAFYSVMFSALGDTNFFFYYVGSMIFFFRKFRI